MTEAQQALEESSAASQAEGITATSVDIGTSFTIGQGVELAAEELRAFVMAELPCAEVSLEGTTLEVEYGAKAGSCTYRGHTFSGTSRVTVAKNDQREVIVDHEWIALSNGRVMLDGTAHVTWDFSNKTRRVVHETRWTSIQSGRTAEGRGDRVQGVLEGGLGEGIRIDGARSWEGERGRWDLGIDGVEMRWTDPVPQAGSYTLATPFDKSVSMSFSRVDDDTIRVSVNGERRGFSFTVSKLGVVEQE